MILTYQNIAITSAGGTISVDPTTSDVYFITGTPVSLANNLQISFTGTAPDLTRLYIYYNSLDTNGHQFSIGVTVIDNEQAAATTGGWVIVDFLNNIPSVNSLTNLGAGSIGRIQGDIITAASMDLDRLVEGTPGNIMLINSSAQWSEQIMSGDATIDDSGVISIESGVIIDAQISNIAAIDRSKIATDTTNAVVINDAGGLLTSESQLASIRGGLGINASSSTGFPVFTAGTASIGSISNSITLNVNFESGETGDYKIQMGFAGTVTQLYGFATKVIAGTDNGTIIAKNNAGTSMTNGTITFTANDARGTAYTVNPTANNTFAALDILTFTTAKTTSGGKVVLSITTTRTS